MDQEIDDKKIVELKIDDIVPNKFQPREVFDQDALQELSDSIKEHGVIQPIIVRRLGDKYELIAGERRCKASTLAGKTTIPAIIRDIDDNESAKLSLLENLQRKNLSAIEEARTYKKILELDPSMTQESLARTMGRSQPMIANKLRLLSLPEEIQDSLIKNQISERHARSLLNVKDKKDQLDFLERIKKERLTVRELEAEIKDYKAKLELENSIQEKEEENTEERLVNEDMNNGNMNMAGGNFNNNPYMDANNYRSNFGNMGLNDYQSSIQNGNFNNIPNISSQATSNYVSPFSSSPEKSAYPSDMYDLPSDSYSELNSNTDSNFPLGNNEFSNNPFDEIENNSLPNNNTLGSMLDESPMVSQTGELDRNLSNDNHFISQIKEETPSSAKNQFLPNFDNQTDFSNQNSFNNNSNTFNNDSQFDNNFTMNNNSNLMNNNTNFNNNPMNDNSFNSFETNQQMNNNYQNNYAEFNNNQPNNMFANNMNNNNNSNYNNNFMSNNNNMMGNNNFNNNSMNGNNNQMNNNSNFNNNPMSGNGNYNFQNDPMANNDYINNASNNQPNTFINPDLGNNQNNSNQTNTNFFPNNNNNNQGMVQSNQYSFNSNQGGLFNQPLNIVSVPNTTNNSSNIEQEQNLQEPNIESEPMVGNSSNSNEIDNNQEESNKKDYIKLEPTITITDPKSAVLELKKTTDRIKQEQIKMDTEEIEFDDYYQITIKIKK